MESARRIVESTVTVLTALRKARHKRLLPREAHRSSVTLDSCLATSHVGRDAEHTTLDTGTAQVGRDANGTTRGTVTSRVGGDANATAGVTATPRVGWGTP